MAVSLIKILSDEEIAWREYLASCNCPYTCGPSHDPYGTSCHLPANHTGDHEGPEPFGNDGNITWDRARGAREMMRRYE